jgi:diguanylate cyclase (GGDEF)-like protein
LRTAARGVRTIRAMSENGARTAPALRAQLAKVDRSREQIAKAWLVDVILNSDLSTVDQTPVAWATSELPQLISDILLAVGSEEQALDGAIQRAARLADQRGTSTSPAQLTREIYYLQSALLATLRMEFAHSHPGLFADAAERLTAVFTRIGAYTVEALTQRLEAGRGVVANGGLMRQRLQQMTALSQRYGSPFALLVLDVEGPGAQNGEQAMGAVTQAIRGSIRLMDEAFQTEEVGLCVLAPNQTADSGSLMAQRLTEILTRLERVSELRITVSTGVVGCPEHGDEPEHLLRAADSAMWRARATGRPFTVAGVQDH